MKFFLLVICCIIFLSCSKWDKKEKIPSYIQINQVQLQTDAATEGENTHKISDVWINVDGNLQGIYEIPVTFPILETGKHTVSIRAGIKVNGIAASRAPYPFFNIIHIDTILPEGKILSLTPVFSYKSETKFSWIEDFQGNGYSLDRMIGSDTVMYIVSDTSNNNKFGKFTIDAIRQKFYYKSSEAFDLPVNGSAVFLELDYRCNHPFTLGLLVNKLQSSVANDIIVLNPHPHKFNHIYIDLTYTVTQNMDALDYNVIIRGVLQDGYSQGEIEIDNLKLLHF
ncbi:MAG: hypothetical protein N2449_10325 [Bacteroidales bacterium]|nr:hypothetical protein [Bacteroidales bacterium]